MTTITKTTTKIAEAVRFYALADADAKAIAKRVASFREIIINYMNEKEIKEIKIDGIVLKKIDVENISINEGILKKSLSNRLFNSLLTSNVDKNKFRAAVKLGAISIPTIKKAVTKETSYRIILDGKLPKITKAIV